jgi:WD40 repeat protein
VTALGFSGDGVYVASSSLDKTIRLWDVKSGQEDHAFSTYEVGVNYIAFSPDGTLLATAGCDRTVALWDVASGRRVRSLNHADEVMGVAFSPDGTLLVSGGYDNLVYVWGIPQ